MKTKRAGQRMFDSMTKFLWDHLKLKVNTKKSAVDWAWIRLANETKGRFKQQVREITRGHRSQPIEERIQQLGTFTRGWINYFRLIDTERLLEDLDGSVQTPNVRKPYTRVRNLRKLGLTEEQCGPLRSGKKYWHLASVSYFKWALNNRY